MTEDTQHKHTDAAQYEDIRPYDDHEFHEKLAGLVKEPGFEHAIRWVMPDVDYDAFVAQLLTVKSQQTFQREVMGPFLELLAAKTTHGVSISGMENFHPGVANVYITNHRDIVLDASFLNLCFIRAKLPLTQVAIGNNLLIYDWITDLVKLNRSFIVKRDTGVREALTAAKHLSGYIHYAINEMHESVWIAQREGRAKDSNDRTQESVIKMLTLGSSADSRESLLELNILPVSISYEYDPNDYLKVREFLLRRRDPEFRKSQRDDLFSMETGILGQKGRVHFHLGECINPQLEQMQSSDRAEVVRNVCAILDRSIHCGYHIYPCNYIAFDKSMGSKDYAAMYTEQDVETFDKYIESQLEKVDVEDITADEHEWMRSMMLTMYANPLKNQREAKDCESCR